MYIYLYKYILLLLSYFSYICNNIVFVWCCSLLSWDVSIIWRTFFLFFIFLFICLLQNRELTRPVRIGRINSSSDVASKYTIHSNSGCCLNAGVRPLLRKLRVFLHILHNQIQGGRKKNEYKEKRMLLSGR